MMHDARTYKLGLLLTFLLWAWVFAPGVAGAGSADEACEAALEEAEELYLDANFDATISTLSECYYRDDLPAELSVQIGRLVALSHMNKDDLDAARRAVLRILSVEPDYQADPVQDPPSYASMVNIVRRQVQAGDLEVPEVAEVEERRGRNWLYVVGGAVLTGAVTTAVALLAGGNGGDAGDDMLPRPPDLP